jgi:histidinol-phosphate phosphatase family protein
MEPLLIDNHWTLFLDRDGVINKNIDDGYVLSWDQFEFLPGVLETMPKLSRMFPRIIIVSNQQCIGKGLLSIQELTEIHQNMMNMIELNGGRIDGVYFAPDLAGPHNKLRKPASGMAFQAKEDFPEIDFSRSVMVGDKDSDIEFGKYIGMTTVCISIRCANNGKADRCIEQFSDLLEVLNVKA